MKPSLRIFSPLAALFLLHGLAACAGESGASNEGVNQGAIETPAARPAQKSDDDIKRELDRMLQGVEFMSESDYPYVVIEGKQIRAKSISDRVLRWAIKDEVKTVTERDISKTDCRAERLSISDVLADATLPDDEENHDALQAALAVKFMREQLQGVVGYTFGTNASGDQDDEGPVVYVYVGKSRTTGKLIGIVTQAVYT